MNVELETSTATTTHKVFIIDDHPLLREGLKSLINLETDLEVCGEIGTAYGTREAISQLHPDVIVLDLNLPDQPGMELLKNLRAEGLDTPILVISSWDERLYARRVLKAKANGYIMKDQAIDRVVEGLRRVLAGHVYLTPEETQFQVNNLGQPNPVDSLEKLTDRELEVMEQLGLGRSTQEIANCLNISSKTVDAHRANIKSKLGIKDLHELIRFSVQLVDNGEVGKA